ncbi:MAG: DUF1707 domain-containing protein [Labedaea sp.]
MNIESSDLRISDTEREDAIQKLGEHMSVGRLGVDEYGDRSARVATAKTRGELLALFTDLPDPRPRFSPAATSPPPAGPAHPAAGPAARPAGSSPTGWDQRPVAQRVWGAMVPLSAILALVLYLTVANVWFVFLLPAVIAVVGGAIWGEDWRHHQHHRSRYHHDGRDFRRRR